MSNKISMKAMSHKLGVVAAFVKSCHQIENVYAALV